MFMGLSNTHTLRTIEMTQDLCLPMPHVYGTLKHSHPQNNRNDTKTCVSQCPMFMGLSNIHTLRTIEMTQDLCLPMPHVYGTLKHSHPQNNRNDTKTCVSQCPMFMGLSNTHTLRTIEMTQDLCLPMPHVYGTLKHSHTQNNRNDTKTCVSQCPMFMGLSNTHTLRTIEMTPRLVSPNAPCLWDSQTLTHSEQ